MALKIDYTNDRTGHTITDSYVRFQQLTSRKTEIRTEVDTPTGRETQITTGYQYDMSFEVFLSETDKTLGKDCIVRVNHGINVSDADNDKIIDNPVKFAYKELKKLDKFTVATDV